MICVFHMKQYLLECNAKEGAATKEVRGGNLSFLQEKTLVATREMRKRMWSVGWGTQVIVLLERGLKERRHDYLGWLKVTQVMATALLCGTLWWHSNANSPSNFEDQVLVSYSLSLLLAFFMPSKSNKNRAIHKKNITSFLATKAYKT